MFRVNQVLLHSNYEQFSNHVSNWFTRLIYFKRSQDAQMNYVLFFYQDNKCRESYAWAAKEGKVGRWLSHVTAVYLHALERKRPEIKREERCALSTGLEWSL